MKKESKPTMFRESKLQSARDAEQHNRLREYIKNSPSDDVTKFDNFPKYTQRTALSRFLARHEMFKHQLDVPGSIIEIGVGRGASLLTWAQLSAIYEPVNFTREIIGFDTFEGVPNLNKKDRNEYNRDSNLVKVKGFQVESRMYEDIKEAIEVYDITRYVGHIPKVKVVKGDASLTVPKFLEENQHLAISLLHLDVDLYKPTKIALELLYNRIPKGGVIVFDELNAPMYPGETIALHETLGIGALRLKRFPWATTLCYAIVE